MGQGDLAIAGSSRQEACLHQGLEAIADTKNRLASGDKGTEIASQAMQQIASPETPTTQIIGVGEPTGENE